MVFYTGADPLLSPRTLIGAETNAKGWRGTDNCSVLGNTVDKEKAGTPMRKFSTAIVFSACLLAACETRIETRGNLPDPDLLETVQASDHSRDQVAQILGSPSTTAMFENETWFYMSERRETFAFFEPEILERKIVIIQFNESGLLKTVAEVSLENGRIITPVDRETPTLGNDLNAIEQMLGNIGKFN